LTVARGSSSQKMKARLARGHRAHVETMKNSLDFAAKGRSVCAAVGRPTRIPGACRFLGLSCSPCREEVPHGRELASSCSASMPSCHPVVAAGWHMQSHRRHGRTRRCLRPLLHFGTLILSVRGVAIGLFLALGLSTGRASADEAVVPLTPSSGEPSPIDFGPVSVEACADSTARIFNVVEDPTRSSR